MISAREGVGWIVAAGLTVMVLWGAAGAGWWEPAGPVAPPLLAGLLVGNALLAWLLLGDADA